MRGLFFFTHGSDGFALPNGDRRTIFNRDNREVSVSTHVQAPSTAEARRQANGRVLGGVAATRASVLRGRGSGASAVGRVGSLALVMAALALSVGLLFAAGAQAEGYTVGSPLSTAGKFASGVAVDQSSHDVYVAACGTALTEFGGCFSGPGVFKEFSSAGGELACSLEGAPAHPASVEVDPTTGNVDVLNAAESGGEMLVYGANCGAELHEFSVPVSNFEPLPEPAVDSSGELVLPLPGEGSFERCSQSGVCSSLGSSPNPVGAALDASGDLYLSTNSLTECEIEEPGEEFRSLAGKLVEYGPDGAGGFTERGAFAGLDGSSGHGEVTAVAVDKRTGQVFVGRGCDENFRIERYRAGGARLEEFGGGLFSTKAPIIYNQLAVDESTGKVYATDPGHQEVQTFGYSGAAFVSLGTSVVGEGSVVCEVEGFEEPCASEYESGTEITLKAVDRGGSSFVKWSSATGSAGSACEGQTTTTCTFTISEGSTAQAEFAVAGAPLTIEKSGSGTVSVTSVQSGLGLEPIACGAHCSELFSSGTVVELSAAAGTGSQFTGWSTTAGGPGTCTGTTSPCAVTMTEAVTLKATSVLESEVLSANVTGPGSVECEFAHSGTFGSCSGPQPYGTSVSVKAVPNAGAQLSSLSGTGSASACSISTCVFEIVEASSVTAGFSMIEHPSMLTVFKGGNGKGTVTSLAPHTGITCGTSCEEARLSSEEGQTIELEESPASGSVFAGWIGCRHAGTTTCQVKLGAPEVEVTAVFLKEGEKGLPGETPTITEFTGAKGPCTAGGIEVKVGATTGYACNGEKGTTGATGANGGTPTITQFSGVKGPCTEGGIEVKIGSSTTYVCDGPKGTTGTAGVKGATGAVGTNGPQGERGAAGAQGTAGPAGSPGPAGPQGAKGLTGPAGKVACKISQGKHKMAKVTCTVKYATTAAAASVPHAVRWRLTRQGHLIRHGTSSGHTARLNLGGLHRGRYLLHITGQSKGVTIDVR